MIFLILLVPVLILVLLLYTINKEDRKREYENKALNNRGQLMFIFVIISVVVSLIISLNADYPSSSNHGAIIYIIYPLGFGFLMTMSYLLALIVNPNLRFEAGYVAIAANVLFGVYMLFGTF